MKGYIYIHIYIYTCMYIQEYNEYIFELGYGLREGGNNGEGCRTDTGRASGRKVSLTLL